MVRRLASFLSAMERAELVALAAKLEFVAGRQGTGYEKCAVAGRAEVASLVARSLAELGVAADEPHDVWVIRYAVGSEIPPHRDEVSAGREHHRLNVIVAAAVGGEVRVEGRVLELAEGDGYVFRPDVMEHQVTRVTAGTRLVWSVGVAPSR
jgi:hypothetical protein